MARTDLMPKQRKEPPLARRAGAFAVSCVFHATFFGLLLWVTLVYGAKWMPPPSGSRASAPSITLSTLVITPAPPPPTPRLPVPETPVVVTTPAETIPEAPQAKPVPVKNSVPILTPQVSKTVAVTQTKTAAPHPVPATPVAKASPPKPKPSAPTPFASSYAPGENILPHPPYPEDAQNLGETGTVVMSVTFGMAGEVTQAEVSRSSGVRLLDTSTRSFILTHWHSTTFAGQTMMQQVRYNVEQ